MRKDKKTVSANEINKFVYCNYQWYYERLYGSKVLRQKYNERNERLNLPNNVSANFVRGLGFHSKYGRKSAVWAIAKILLLAAAGVGIYVLWKAFC